MAMDERTPTRPRMRKARAVTSGITWLPPEQVPGAVLSAEAQRRLTEKLRAIDRCQAEAMASARIYVIYR